MSRRTSAVIATFTVFGLTFGTTAATTGSATASTGGPGPRPQVVRSAHPHGVQVARNSRGRLTNLAANPLSPITVPDPSLARQARPSALLSARAHVRVLAPSLGVPDAGKDLTATLVRPLAGQRSVVRLAQRINGVEAFGARVVVGLDSAGSLQSLASRLATTPSTMTARVSAAVASSVARAAVARGSKTPLASIKATYVRASVLDPTVVGVSGTRSRLTWRVGVTATTALESSGDVFVDATTGVVLLRVPWANPALNRVVCDRTNSTPESLISAFCDGTISNRAEGDAPSGITDVDQAYDQLGRSASFYQGTIGLDLTQAVGSSDDVLYNGGSTTKQLRATTHACVTGATRSCPMANAFYFPLIDESSGTFYGGAMFFGTGFTAGDDVVAHELTHGVTQRTSELIYSFESGAINESMSDVFGELVDQAYDDGPGDQADDASWKLGEDLGPTPIRSMSDPTQLLYGARQPDRLSSGYWYNGPNDDAHDNGGVHYNSGVGNKAAYLIGHGGTFNGVNVTGLGVNQGPGQATGIQKMASLYWDVQNHLLPGSSYADLGRQLVQSAAQLGWTGSDLQTVKNAVHATEMDRLKTTAAVSATKVNIGGIVKVVVRATTIRGGVAARVAMRLYRRIYPGTTYSLYGTGITAANGTITWNVKPAATTRYYAAVTPGSVGSAALVYTPAVVVRPVVSAASSNYRPRRGAYFLVTGKVVPRGGRVTLQRLSGSRWVSVTSTPLFSTGGYAFRVRSSRAGTKYLRVVDFASASHGTGVSRSLKIRVL